MCVRVQFLMVFCFARYGSDREASTVVRQDGML